MERYLLRVIVVCFTSGILLSMVRGSAAQAAVKLLCGAYLAVTFFSPLTRIDFGRELGQLLPDSRAGDRAVREGEVLAREKIEAIIKGNTEAYILDKAESLHAELRAEILVDGEVPVPVAVKLTGRASPSAKAQLERILWTDLGIPKENLQWSG